MLTTTSLAGGVTALAALTLAIPSSAHGQGRTGILRVGVGEHETSVRAIGHLGTLRAGGSPVLLLALDEFPLDQYTRTSSTSSGRASAGTAIARTDPVGRAAGAAQPGASGFSQFQPIAELGIWVSIDENTHTDFLTCPKPQVFGATGAGRTTLLALLCVRATVRDPSGGSLLSNWTDEATDQPPDPVRAEFTTGSTTLDAATIERLRRLLEQLRKLQDVEVVVEGYAELGEVDPDILAGRRAEVVRDYLVAGGMRQDRVHVISHGDDKPIATGGAEQAWSHNRNSHTTILLSGRDS